MRTHSKSIIAILSALVGVAAAQPAAADTELVAYLDDRSERIRPLYEQYHERIEDAIEQLHELGKLPTGVSHRRFAATVFAMLVVESNGDVRAHSYAGAHGLMQVKAGARDEVLEWLPLRFSEDPYHAYENILVGAGYLAYLARTHELSLPEAVVAYNRGYGGYQEWRKRHALEENEYLQRVYGIRKIYAVQANVDLS